MTKLIIKRAVALAMLLLVTSSAVAAEKPNILFIFTDDLGYKDLGVYGSDLYRTPHLDQLASQGTRFTNAYTAAPVCSPTRASLVTGKTPARLHLTDWLTGHAKPHAKLLIPDWTKGLPAEEITLAELLKPQGYKTAWFGKWHLGEGAQDHGFDAGNQTWELNRKEDGEDPKGVFTLNREALEFIEANKQQPFFVAVSHYSPHGPIRFNEELKNEYVKLIEEKKPIQTNAGYAAMIEALDTSIGELLAGLEKSGVADNTLVIFFSDNGGELNFTNNAPLRDGKGTLYEGGVRVPLIARWPGKIPSAKVSDEVISSIDFFPTFAALTGAELPKNIDGIDVTPALKGTEKLQHEALHWHYPHYHRARPSGSILKGEWKLIEWFETGKTELFHLAKDPYEEHDLAATNPSKNAELLEDLRRWRTDVGAQLTSHNPQYDPETETLNERQIQRRNNQKK